MCNGTCMNASEAQLPEAIWTPCSTHLQRFDAVGRGGQLVRKALRLALQLLPLLLAELGRSPAAAAGRGAAAAAAAGDAGQGEDGQQQDGERGAARLSCTGGAPSS